MTICKTKRFVKWKICRGDLRNPIQILTRQQLPQEFGQMEPTIDFAVLLSPRAAIETVTGTTRFKGVNIEKTATHLFFIAYAPSADNLDHGNNFIKHKDRYYRILKLTNRDEDNQYIMIQTAESGDATKLANEA